MKWLERIILYSLIIYLLWGKYTDWRHSRNFVEKHVIDTVETVQYRNVYVKVPQPYKEVITVRDTAIKTIIKEAVPDTQYVEVPRLFHRDDPDIKIEVNTYRDTLDVDGAKLRYEHHVLGTLLDSKYSISYPKTTITDKASRYRKSAMFLFLTNEVGKGQLPQIEIGLAYYRENIMAGYSYDLSLGSHNFTIGYRIH